ncbi:MAG: metalloregulator ArsR/SmtB family transcription factor [Planctomycetes bacterium]|nr:metalloregulator ArsR/SmtB family transcription factor [Planctomycetota bacterium]
MDTPSETPALLSRLTTLGDLARLRMLRLLDAHELSVGELARALQLPQSTVSRHLKVLHEGHWVIKRTEGTASLYRLVEDALAAPARALWRLAREDIGTSPTLEEDDSRLAEVLVERRHDSRAFFGRVGGEWDQVREDLFGHHFTAEALPAFVDEEWTVADLGCGTGNASEMLAPYVRRIVAVDREPSMLAAARKRLEGMENVEFLEGELTELPLADGAVNAAMIFLVLHHLEHPETAVAEAGRILADGGVLLVVDMVSHDRESYRHTMGHRHLGFDEATVAGWTKRAGLHKPGYHRLRPDTHAMGPGLFVATMRKKG